MTWPTPFSIVAAARSNAVTGQSLVVSHGWFISRIDCAQTDDALCGAVRQKRSSTPDQLYVATSRSRACVINYRREMNMEVCNSLRRDPPKARRSAVVTGPLC